MLHVLGSPRELEFRLGGLREAIARRALGNLDCALVYFDSAVDGFRRRWVGREAEVRRFALPRPQVTRSN